MNRKQILQEADRCVKCGICLPLCPTYRLTRDEGDSPRGRIALIQALTEGKVDSPRLRRHLDRCLCCRACEAACPSGVRYGGLIDAARAHYSEEAGTMEKLQKKLITESSYQPWSRHLFNFYLSSGLRPLSRTLGGRRLQRLDDLLPHHSPSTSIESSHPARGKQQGRIALFTGCAARLTEKAVLDSAIRVLTRSGVEVIIPELQGCCGAMHQHSGDSAKAGRMAEINIDAFNRRQVDTILYLASGCGAQLEEYPTQGHCFDAPVMEISRFLVDRGYTGGTLRPLAKQVALHTPCSLKNVLHGEREAVRLLEKIPQLAIHLMDSSGSCCGAAGAYMLNQSDMADRLREESLEALEALQPDILATSNSGCSMHLAAGISGRNLPIEVLHPVQLIDRQSGPDTAVSHPR